MVRTRDDVSRAALKVLIDEGLDAVTHSHVAWAAGYSKATLYAHWPGRAELLRDAFTHLLDLPHHRPTGDLRTDLVEELVAFRTAITDHKLDRPLAVLAELTASEPALADVRDQIIANGEEVMRSLLEPVTDRTERDAVMLMLSGAVCYSALMHGRPPDREVIATAVDLMLRGLGQDRSAPG